MSTYTKEHTNSAIPRATRAAPLAAIGPRPTKASLLRASQVKQDLTGGRPAENRKAVVTQRGSEIRTTAIPMRRQMEKKEDAVTAGKKVGGSVRGAVGAVAKVGAAVLGSKVKVMRRVAAPAAQEVVSYYEASVKKADSALQPKKKVHFAAKLDQVKLFETTAGEKAPWRLKKGEKQESYEGEPDWEFLKAQQQYNGEKGTKFVNQAKALLKAIEDLNETDYCEYFLPVQDVISCSSCPLSPSANDGGAIQGTP